MEKRPKYYDKEVVNNAALEVFPRIANIIDDDSEESLKQLCQAIRSEPYDSYKMAKYLDDKFCWEICFSLVEELESINLSAHHVIAQKNWVEKNNITPPFDVGEMVKTKKGIGEVIENTEHGTSLVFIESIGHIKEGIGTHGILFNWEDLEDGALGDNNILEE